MEIQVVVPEKQKWNITLKRYKTSQKAVKYLCKMSVALYTGTEEHNALSHTILSFMCVHTAIGKSPTQRIFIQLLANFITSCCVWVVFVDFFSFFFLDSLMQGILLIETFCLPGVF